MPPQSEFDFTQSQAAADDGLTHWQRQREHGLRQLASRLGLPLNRMVEVWLKDGVRLRGLLQLKEAALFLESVDEHTLQLTVNRVDFRYSEIESCLRTD